MYACGDTPVRELPHPILSGRRDLSRGRGDSQGGTHGELSTDGEGQSECMEERPPPPTYHCLRCPLAIVGRNQQRAGGKGQSTGVIWGKPQSYDSGVHPSVACMGSGIVVEVHQSERRSKLFSKIGIVKPGEVKWRQAEVYGDGVMPAVAVTDLGMLIEVHQSENYQSVYYRYRHSIPFVTPSSLLSPSLTFLSISPTLLPLLASSTLLLLFFLPPSSCSSVSLWGYSTPSVMSWNGE